MKQPFGRWDLRIKKSSSGETSEFDTSKIQMILFQLQTGTRVAELLPHIKEYKFPGGIPTQRSEGQVV
jgi:hypothetical protein